MSLRNATLTNYDVRYWCKGVKEKDDSDNVLDKKIEYSSRDRDTTASHGSVLGTFYKFPLDALTNRIALSR
jgi:hypothetical protein